MSSTPFVVEGRHATARLHAADVEAEALEQIRRFLDHPAFDGARIAIMPDVHAGIGAVIGFTSTLTDKVIPNVIGVDIGCGVAAWCLGRMRAVDFPRLDASVRTLVPSGRQVHHLQPPMELWRRAESLRDEVEEVAEATGQQASYVLRSLGTLGGGNHFIELDRDEQGDVWLVVHSGSRNFGLQIANWHQRKALDQRGKMQGLEYLEGRDADLYFSHMKVAQRFAALNRRIMGERLLAECFERGATVFVESVHNYIDFELGIIRKGAISARRGERVIIPWNMRDGTIIGTGLGNPEWNESAPHGAGRKMGRRAAKAQLSLGEFHESMKGIWTSCVSRDTLDESPMAYKDWTLVASALGETVAIERTLAPLYNFKASE